MGIWRCPKPVIVKIHGWCVGGGSEVALLGDIVLAADDAALVVRTYRHSRPEAVPLTGTAEGVVDGVRQSVPLHFKATGQPGVFAVNQSWPNEGAWVLAISTGEKLHLLVELGPNGGIMPTSYFGQSSADLSLRSVRVVTGNLPERDIDKSLTTLAMQ